MSRNASLALISFLLGGAVWAAPGAKDLPQKAYYPTKVGTKRVYDQTGGGRYVEVITEVKTKDGQTQVTVCEETDGQLEPSDVVAVSEKGLTSLFSGSDKFDPPVTFLKLDAKPGDGWDVDSAAGGLKLKGRFTLKGEEEVEVPAGKFKALRVESDMMVNGRPFKATAWYVREVGMVKSVNPSRTLELKSISAEDK